MSRWTGVPAALIVLLALAIGALAYGASPPGTTTGTTAEADAASRQKPETCPCKGLFRIYYFDSDTSNCRDLIWGGCQRSVPFKTLDQRRKDCLPPTPSQYASARFACKCSRT